MIVCCMGFAIPVIAQNLSVTITAPSDGDTVSNTVPVAAIASDDLGVVGVLFKVDGANLGTAVLSLPYTNVWSTLDMSNGLHTVQAIALNLAGDRATNTISVTVNNPLLPIPTNEWVAIYRFNEGSGTTVTDASWNGNNGTISNAVWNPEGKFGSCLSFDGSAWVTVNDSASLDLTNGMTLEAWVYPTNAATHWTTFLLKESSSDLDYMLAADPSGYPAVYIATTSGEQGILGPSTLPLNTWSHLAGTYDGATLKLYVNGVKVAENPVTGSIITSPQPLRIGGNAIWGEYWSGNIDEVRIYNQALTQIQIQTDMDGLALLTITADSTNRIYGTANPAFTGSVTGLQYGDNITTTFFTAAGLSSPVGNYTIVPAFSDPDGKLSNYIIITNQGTLTVTQASLAVTANSTSKTYGQTLNFAGTEFTTAGLVTGDSVSNLDMASAGAAGTATVGSYGITATNAVGSGLTNYTINYVDGTLTVTQASLTVTANSANKPYGQTLDFLGTEFGTVGLVNGDTVTTVALSSTGAAATAGVSSYDIIPGDAAGSGLTNYMIGYVNGTLTVGPVALTVTANSTTKTYGQTLDFAGTEFGTGGLLNSDAVSSVSLSSTGAVSTASSGSYSIVATGAVGTGLGNYTISYVDGSLTVNPATLTVAAVSTSRPYGETNPVFTVSYSGFAGVDGTNVLQGSPELTTQADTNSPVGDYTIYITQGNLSSTNYGFSFTNGLLTITRYGLTVTANSASKVYGQTLTFAGTEFAVAGLVNGDTVTNVTLSSDGAAGAAGVGGYYIAPTNAMGNGLTNYTIDYAKGTLTVTQASLTVTANSTNKVYGKTATFAGTEFATSGLCNEDTVTTVTLTSSGAAGSATIGDYSIVPTNAVGTGLTNYTIGYTSGILSVTSAPITILANAQSKTYGNPDPTLTYQITSGGLVNGDTLVGALGRATGENVGLYAIQLSTLSAGTNYSVTYSGANLRILRRSLLVQADNKSRSYGQTNPVFTVTYTTLVNGDGPGSLGGTLAFNTAATVTSPVAGYAVVPSGVTSSNYSINFGVGTLTVTQANLTVTANAQIKTYGNSDPALTYQITAGTLYNGDHFTGALSRVAGENAGTRAIQQGTLSAGNNYALSYVGANLTIQRRPLSAQADNKTRPFGAANPVFTISYGGFAFSDTTNSLQSLPTAGTSATTTSPAGPYVITVTGGADTNYVFNPINGTLTITPPASVTLVSITPLPAGAMRINGTGDTNVTYTMEASSNLVQWLNLGATTSSGIGAIQFDDATATNSTTRFYRTSLP